MSELLETVEVATSDNVQYSIIWMHGLGADANDFVPIVPELKLPADIGVRFVFPNAPIRPITINNGMAMRGWFDILELGRIDRRDDEAGLRESQAAIEALIKRENERGIPTEKIFLAGFSQGCAMTLMTGLRHPERLAGLLCLSGFLPLNQKTAEEVSQANRDVPIFMAHGEYDPVLPLALGEFSRSTLEGLGYQIEWHTYPMAHQVCGEEVQDLNNFLNRHLK